MGFTEAVVSAFRKDATSSGRASRSEFWWFFLFIVVGLIAAGSLGADTGSQIVLALFYLSILLPLLAIVIRRLHDTDRSGYWFLIQCIPLAGMFFLLALMMLPGTDGPNRFGEPRSVEA